MYTINISSISPSSIVLVERDRHELRMNESANIHISKQQNEFQKKQIMQSLITQGCLKCTRYKTRILLKQILRSSWHAQICSFTKAEV